MEKCENYWTWKSWLIFIPRLEAMLISQCIYVVLLSELILILDIFEFRVRIRLTNGYREQLLKFWLQKYDGEKWKLLWEMF